jgi:acyl dehydratase
MPQADLSYDAIELGKSYGPYKYPLGERIARILEATENAHSWHHGRSPWGPPVAPPSILGSICMRFIDWIAPIAPGTMHARQDVRTDAALRLDRQPIAYGTFVEKYERRGRRWAVFETRLRDETGLIIGRSRTTLAFPERVKTANEHAENGDSKLAERKGELTPITRTITQEKMTAFSEDSANARRGTSLHISPDVAKKAGFETTIAQGMMTADYISEVMTGVLGKEWFAYAGLSLTFLQPILCGDTLTANGRLQDETMDGAVLHKMYEVWAENQRGEAVTAGSADALVMPGR